MARNEEKQHGKLNRLHLQKLKEEWLEKNPKRPRLNDLHTASEIKKWLPSIKKDIEHSLMQSEVTCYSESKISEIQNEIVKLEKIYKAFVRKMVSIDPSSGESLRSFRPYRARKTRCIDEGLRHLPYSNDSSSFIALFTLDAEKISVIRTPLLDKPGAIGSCDECFLTDLPLEQDAPLQFKSLQANVIEKSDASIYCNDSKCEVVTKSNTKAVNILGLSYEDSSEESEETS